ncbi:vitelline membrane outer layer protein 1 homolog [Ruditapes philippinarum]|uniref:vitelline membrane outer layer protein 1 homolog n=1 Tax=Ruditapes philippinarum TaxID=129788 RepID=UPI00295B83FE|nr:vitelline membrane outer layer protein 1 homolog [Ruditapes philippinarum]
MGFNMMYDDNDAKEADRTGLNVINISCANRKGTRVKNQRSVQSPLGGRGHWTGDVICPRSNGIPLFLQSFELMVHEPKQSEDDTKANVVRFTCRDSHWKQQPKSIEKHIAGAKGQFGKSSEKCPKDSAICGLQSRVEGHIHHGDNTALNDVRFFCCRFK